MENLCDLLFELSSAERMNMLNCLRDERLKLSHLAKRLDMTVTETSRHLQRLSDADIVARDADGTYSLTALGGLVLQLLGGLSFVSDHGHYFNGHSMSSLPPGFIHRLGELAGSRLDEDTVKVFEHARNMLLGAEEYIWVQSYQHLLWNNPIILEKMRGGVDFRFILPSDVEPPPEYKPDPATMSRTRTLDRVEVRVALTEKEASLSFPRTDGSVDYAAFISGDPGFRTWCRDLFMHFWEKANPSASALIDGPRN
jgi:predicted transcriptional regulator